MRDLSRPAAQVEREVRRHPAWLLLPVAVLALTLFLIALLEGDLPDFFSDAADLTRAVLRRFGAPASLTLLYMEESGIPLPIPGDVYVAYLGRLASGSWLRLVLAWLAVVATVVLGSSNLYLVARKWGYDVVHHRLAHALHIEARRIETAEQWFGRWGALAIIFGRHIPGFRIPVTVVSGVFKVPYRVFAPSVAVSTAFWAALWVYLGARFGPAIGHWFTSNRWTYGVAALVVILIASYIVVRIVRAPSGKES